MFLKKQKSILVFLILLSCTNFIFASSKVINSLSLDFTRNETQLATGSSSQIKGKITFCKNPFVFIFEVTSPAKQLMYINDEGAYLLDKDTVYEIPDNVEFLQQTCQDFLNWFKEDMGLSETGFAPSLTWLEDGHAVTQWDCRNNQEQPIDKVLVCTDSYGRFTELKMYYDSQILVTQTTLAGFEYSAGFYYPSQIISVSYDQQEVLGTTELLLGNVKFNLTQDALYSTKKLELVSQSPDDLSAAKSIESPVTPAQTVYRVSIPSVLADTSFKFYKKFITNQDMTNCPFYPSCSQYMIDAINTNGLAGFIQGMDRLKRCTSTEHSRNLYPTLSNGKHYDPVVELGAKK